MSQSKNWCFTLNNYTDKDEAAVAELPRGLEYIIYGREVGESGTPHLQGFARWSRRVRLSQVSRLFPNSAHWTVARNVQSAIQYCKKDGDYVEIGSPPVAERARTDLDAFKQGVRSGLLSLNDVRETYSAVYARYPRFCLEYLHQHLPSPEVPDHPLKAWQQQLKERLDASPSDREIFFVVDEAGGEGKSFFAAYYQKHRKNTLLCLPGKKADMVYALASCGFVPEVILVDAPRSKQGEYIQYDFLEELKNGRIFNTKYESRMLQFPVPHVVVFMNEQPDMTKLSEDRYVIITL